MVALVKYRHIGETRRVWKENKIAAVLIFITYPIIYITGVMVGSIIAWLYT